MNNRFEPDKYRDHTIVDEAGTVVGHIRVKPSSILWAPKNAKRWYGLPLDRFAQLMETEGKMQQK
jgi:hypothetical protein